MIGDWMWDSCRLHGAVADPTFSNNRTSPNAMMPAVAIFFVRNTIQISFPGVGIKLILRISFLVWVLCCPSGVSIGLTL